MMKDEEIKQSRAVITGLIQKGAIVKPESGFAEFFLSKSESSLQTCSALIGISKSSEAKKLLNLPQFYESYMWAVNTGYYSMFYAATALLAFFSNKIKTDYGIHALTCHALVYYFLDCDKKLTKHILEQYSIAERESSELLRTAEEEARNSIESVRLEMGKRRDFTYEMGMIAIKSKAETSEKRAREFLTLVKELMLNKKL
jgi:uncharacterized protein (UPF0332 family)